MKKDKEEEIESVLGGGFGCYPTTATQDLTAQAGELVRPKRRVLASESRAHLQRIQLTLVALLKANLALTDQYEQGSLRLPSRERFKDRRYLV